MKQISIFLLLVAIGLCYITLAKQTYQLPRNNFIEEMQLTLPRPMQIGLALGDQNLAANFASLRALITTTYKLTPEQFAVLARVQEDVSAFNPAHEDNYYIATAILPWEGQLEATQVILNRARTTRPFDYQPAFYEAFNAYHFKKDAALAASILAAASASIKDQNNQIAMLNLAAKWSEKGYTPDVAEKVIAAMAKQSNNPEFKKYLLIRASRLNTLQKLQDAASQFYKTTGKKALDFNELLQAGFIKSLPKDPFEFGYIIDNDGVPQILNKKMQ